MSETLAMIIQELDVFSSIYDIKVFAYLVRYPHPQSGKSISTALQISDSKIYPALNRLVDLDLITKDDNDRPHNYYLKPPDQIITYLDDQVGMMIERKKELLDKVVKYIYEGWSQVNPISSKLTKIYRDKEIITEISSLSKLDYNSVRFILGKNARPYLDVFGKLIQTTLARNIQIDLSMPHTQEFVDVFEELLNKYRSLIELKQSNLKLETYVIFDQKIVFAMVHQNIADIAYYSDDTYLINQARGLWSDPNATVHFHRLIRSE